MVIKHPRVLVLLPPACTSSSYCEMNEVAVAEHARHSPVQAGPDLQYLDNLGFNLASALRALGRPRQLLPLPKTETDADRDARSSCSSVV
ncbi:hypothetical protein OE88DRAFT_1654774 [Heliocybe sulcata]|uniref:Uncharacterized protein n=1 Tax=Heliocybe sulcata TaxID=5364 RepID=A0A5C3NBF9_9AGAM|nr:hypothetical protein OE88DRAFT_1654774 [Heliocybe sulcata]